MKKIFRGATGRSKGSSVAQVTEAVKRFCDSGAPNTPNTGGDEITHLPTIVEGAESSPAIAGAAAYKIRKLIQDGYTKAYIQYNAIMLIRILVDNPGPNFTRHFDSKFIFTIKTCLQSSRDPSVQQMLRETLTYFQTTKSQDGNLTPLLNMWQHEQSTRPQPSAAGGARPPRPPPRQDKLPPPEELAARISEARSSAQLLIQLSESTPPGEVQTNELMKEFADRVQAANRNLHGFMNCTDPAPDEHTFSTLIETCEQLSVASSRHQRAVLAARQQLGQSPRGGSNVSPQAPQLQPSPSQVPQSLQPPIPQQQQYQQQRTSNSHLDSRFAAAAPSSSQRQYPSQQNYPTSQDPFSDDHRISYPPETQRPQPNGVYPAPQPSSYPNQTSNPKTPTTTQIHELPGSADEDFGPPSGPPPGQGQSNPHAPYGTYDMSKHTYPGNEEEEEDDDYDLYNTGNTPVIAQAPRQEWQQSQGHWQNVASSARAQGQDYNSQQGAPPVPQQRPQVGGVTESYLGRQDEAASGMVMSGAGSPPPANANTDGKGRVSNVRDDEPVTPARLQGGWQ